ncbi:MAG: ATP-binding protein [Gammaproteobacteria bacterium]|nr:ATP-binding protein [Gammaproteobacteria bacterium]
MDPTLLKSVLIEQREAFQVQDPTIEREALLAVERHIDNPQVLVVSGLRRSGKSVLLAQIWNKHYHDNAYFITFEDERLLAFTAQDFNTLLECCMSLFGEHKTFFLDEIQNIEHWEMFVRRLQERGYKFFITGSNAALLSGELASRLTGRNIQFELYPFSFREFLQFKRKLLDEEKPLPSRQYTIRSSIEKAALSAAFETYLTQGGIPLYLKYQDPLLLKQIYDDILYKDIILRHRIEDPKTLRELSLYLLSNVAHTLTYTSVKNQLKLGSLNTVKNYLHYFESSYLFFFVSIYSPSVKQQQMSPKKIYAIDTGMVNLLSFKVSRNTGSLLENLVYIELKRRGGDVFYYQCARQYEVDFLVRQGTTITALIQVCESLHQPETRERELRALWMSMDELQLNQGLILTRDYEETITNGDRTIEIRPVYEWLLGA